MLGVSVPHTLREANIGSVVKKKIVGLKGGTICGKDKDEDVDDVCGVGCRVGGEGGCVGVWGG